MAARRGGAGTAADPATTTPAGPRRPRPRQRQQRQQRHRDNPDAYIAGDRRRALGDDRELPDRANGSAVFADISGFTPLTEALAKELGPQRGAEELTAALDVVFDAVLGELHRFGGSVIYFSGDAVTCWLDGDDGLLGVACALAMQRAMSSVCGITTPAGTEVELGMKVAVAAGRARRFVVGDPDIQLIDVLAGSLMDRLAATEHHAERGEVLVDGATLDALHGRIAISAVRGADDDRGTGDDRGADDGRAAVVESVTAGIGALAPPPPYPKLPRAVVRQWLLPAVYERMRTGRGEFLSELRPAVPMFVRFGGVDYDEDEDAPTRLDDFVRRAQRLVDGHGGNVLQLTIGDKGAYLYAVFGSPLAHEDDAARACAAALDVLALEGGTAATGLQVGIAKGRLRSGTYGHRERRTFCCLGDAVNLAARLMSAAPEGQIYVTADVAKAAASRFDFEELGAMTVKGKSAAVAVRRLLARRDHREPRRLRALHPLVGREADLDRLVCLAGEALSGRGQLVGICAEAGMGKSSLAAVLAEVLEGRGVPVFVGAAASAGGGSYLVWQGAATSLFGLSGDEASPGEVVERIERALREVDESLLPRLALLGPLVGVAIDDNELTAGFDAKLRKTSLESLVVQYLSRRAARGPVTIVLEDCHWIDPLSADLLDLVARVVANLPVLLLATYRPGTFSAPALGHTTVVELDRLDEASCREVLVARLRDLYGADRVPAGPLVDRLVARAEGNPFYLGELASYLHDQGADPTDASAAGIELPSSLSSLVLSRIDTLGEGARRTLKVASVVGRDFDVDILAGAYPTLGGTRQVLGQLRALVAQDLVVSEDPSADRYAFRHAMIQEVAYESLPFALRATVHGRVGTWLETTAPGALDLLAHHFWHSREEPKKREYLHRAGVAAAERYANEAAADYFRRLAPLVDGAEREDVLRRLGAVLEFLGAFSEADGVYHQVLELAERRGDPGGIAWARVAISEPLQKQGRYAEALAELDIAERLLEEIGDAEGLGRVPHIRGVIANRTGKPEEAWAYFQHSLEIRRPLGDQVAIATTLHNLGVAAMHRGDLDVATDLTSQSLELRLALGDKWHCSGSHNNLGYFSFLRHDYARAIPHFEEAVRLGTEIGASWTVAMARQNLGSCARELGDATAAREHYTWALDTYVNAGDRRNVCIVFDDVAMLCASTDPAGVLRLIAATDAIREGIGAARMDYEQAELDVRARVAEEWLGHAAVGEQAKGRTLDYTAAIALCRELCAV